MTKRPIAGTSKFSLKSWRKWCSFSSVLTEASASREAAFSCRSARKSAACLVSTAATAGCSQTAQITKKGARRILERGLRIALLQRRRIGSRGFAECRRLPWENAIVDLVLSVLAVRSEEHTSELQSLMRISYAVF